MIIWTRKTALAACMAAVTVSISACHDSSNSSSSGTMSAPPPVLNTLAKEITIGSTSDPASGSELNPYGLAIAQASVGAVTKGDLIICNFNDGPTNTQGKGTTLVGLPATHGASPYTIAQSASLLGCPEVVTLPDGKVVVAAEQANSLSLVTPTGIPGTPAAGTITSPFAADTFTGPWGLALVAKTSGNVLYVSNVTSGAIDRITLNSSDAQTGFTEVVTGFSTNNGVPGAILAPAGLTYDASIDTLYVVDSNMNRVVALANVSAIGTDGVAVTGTGFTGASASSARVIASGAPLNGPLSAALLYNGDLVVGNTGDPDGTNLLIEVSPSKGIVATRNVDFDQAGALFGIVATGTNAQNQMIYFNDDNDATVKVLSN